MKYRFSYQQPLIPVGDSNVIYFKTCQVKFDAGSDIKARDNVIQELKGKQFWYKNKFYPCKLISLDALRPIPLSHIVIDDMELVQ
jgi:hypothetical protein